MIYTLTVNPALDYYLTVNNFQESDLNCAISSNYSSGGKGINVSKVLNNFNVSSIALGFIGGFSGKEIQSYLNNQKIANNFITINDTTRINIKLINNSTNKETEISGKPINISNEEQQSLLNIIRSIVTKDDIIVCSGSIPSSLPYNFYKLISSLVPKETQIVLDTRGKSLLDNIHNNLLIKPNISELEETFNKKFKDIEDIIKTSNELINKGVQNILISMGKEGSLFINKNNVYHALPINVKLVNSVGAGDSMVAGFLFGYISNLALKDCFKLAVASATATVSSSELANKDLALQYLEKVKIEIVNNI